jgi:hypothetical protein
MSHLCPKLENMQKYPELVGIDYPDFAASISKICSFGSEVEGFAPTLYLSIMALKCDTNNISRPPTRSLLRQHKMLQHAH